MQNTDLYVAKQGRHADIFSRLLKTHKKLPNKDLLMIVKYSVA